MRDVSGWIEFFTKAGIPQTVRKTYAQIFLDHRITNSVVPDLDKDHLKDMGITVIGDIISILKQCKKVGHELHLQAGDTAVRRRMTKEIEGNYVIKQPVGNTPKTQKILTTINDKCNIGDVETKSSLGGSDGLTFKHAADSSTASRVIMPKQAPVSSKVSKSVFDRLGGDPHPSAAEPCSSPAMASNQKKEVLHRIIRNSLPNSTSPIASSQNPPAISSRGSALKCTLPKFVPTSLDKSPVITLPRTPVVAGVKRQSTASVFARLSGSSSDNPIGILSPPPADQLGYSGVLKKKARQANSGPSTLQAEFVSNSHVFGANSINSGVTRRLGPVPSTTVKTRAVGSALSKPPGLGAGEYQPTPTIGVAQRGPMLSQLQCFCLLFFRKLLYLMLAALSLF